jgi:hypothetical protein
MKLLTFIVSHKPCNILYFGRNCLKNFEVSGGIAASWNGEGTR